MNNRNKKNKGIKSGKKHKNMQRVSQDPEDPENSIRSNQQTMGWRRLKGFFSALRSILFTPLSGLDYFASGFFWLQLTAYRLVTRKEYPLFLNGKSVSNAQITELTRENESLKKKNSRLEEWIQHCDSEIEELRYQLTKEKNATEKERADVRNLNKCLQELSQKHEDMRESNRKLKEEKTSIEKEKEDALRRLSELVSVRLRDNNPNIVDLNDPCRPTKLAEMFSELYDNEWTSAYAVLEGTFTETQAIVILLDTMMEAYEFCEERMEERWNTLEKWFLNSNLPGAQQTCKWLKDSRKATILEKLTEVDTEFGGLLEKMCNNEDVGKILSDKIVRSYITKCVELSLLMATTDPPVVLGCPLWVSSKMMSATKEDVTNLNDNGNQDEIAVDEEQPNDDTDEADNLIQVDDLNKSSSNPEPDVVNSESLSDAQRAGPDSGIENDIANEPANEPDGQKSSVATIPTQRSPFEKETFKEYTIRGKYLDFIVWPAMYLHKNGPLLAKGIAQGSKEESNDQGATSWIWRRKLPSNVE